MEGQRSNCGGTQHCKNEFQLLRRKVKIFSFQIYFFPPPFLLNFESNFSLLFLCFPPRQFVLMDGTKLGDSSKMQTSSGVLTSAALSILRDCSRINIPIPHRLKGTFIPELGSLSWARSILSRDVQPQNANFYPNSTTLHWSADSDLCRWTGISQAFSSRHK